MSTSDHTDLLKLSREQLKQLCKERGHTAYSKCTKPQLVALLGSDAPSRFNPSMITAVKQSKRAAPSSASAAKKRLESRPSCLEESAAKRRKGSTRLPSETNPSTNPSVPPAPSQVKQKSRVGQTPPTLRELLVPSLSTAPATISLSEKHPVLPSVSRLVSQRPHLELKNKPQIAPNPRSGDRMDDENSLPATGSSLRPSGTNGRQQLSKKFLNPWKPAPNGCLEPPEPQNILRSTKVASSSNLSVEPLPAPYLDFSALPVPVLGLIGMPPSISDRKRVHSWSIILSAISNAERRTCALVSRVLRYAVYLSASVILFSKFPGKRLEDIARVYSPLTFNFWPYLRARKTELAEQRNRYLESFLHRFYKSFEPIGRRLWASPDNPKQYGVAVRFVMSRLCFAVSKYTSPSDPAPWLRSIVVSVRELVQNEIWEITTTTAVRGPVTAKEEIFYVLEPTCEVIGRPTVISPSPSETDPNRQGGLPIRVDWSGYVNDRITSLLEVPGKKLLDRVQWAHYEEYQNGISRHFLKQTLREGEVGDSKRLIAEKYILASVVENSVSGTWKSVQDMAHESFASVGPGYVSKRSKMTMMMFLPGHHHVESVHFRTPDKGAFHPAVAAVQTQAREYYILKDNGMLIGTEEEGINPLWQALLGCNEKGLPSDSSALSAFVRHTLDK